MGMENNKFSKELNELINPCFDPVFKSIFTKDTPESKNALRGLVSAILQKDLKVVDVTSNEPPVNNTGDKQIRYDINCVLDDGEKANVEMTLWPNAHEVCKMEYYLARLHATQEIKGKEKGYQSLKQSYQISIFAKGNVFKDKEFFHRFIYFDPLRGVNLGGRTALCTVELKKLQEIILKSVQEMTRLEMWAIFFAYFTDPGKQDILRQIMAAEEEIGMAQKMINRISAAEAAALYQMSRDKYEMDMATLKYEIKLKKRRLKRIETRCRKQGLEDGIKQGIEQGLSQGIQQGLSQGIEQGLSQGIQQGLSQGAEQTKQEMALRMEALGFSEEQIQAIIGKDRA